MTCRIGDSFKARSAASYCKAEIEKRTMRPHKIIASGIDHADMGSITWYGVVSNPDCYVGAVWDADFGSNRDKAQECADSLNRIAGKFKYVPRLINSDWLLSDDYDVVHKDNSMVYQMLGSLGRQKTLPNAALLGIGMALLASSIFASMVPFVKMDR